MMYKVRRRKPEPTLLASQWIFDLPHQIGMVWDEVDFDDTKLYIVGKWIAAPLNVMAVMGHQPNALTNWAISPPMAPFKEHELKLGLNVAFNMAVQMELILERSLNADCDSQVVTTQIYELVLQSGAIVENNFLYEYVMYINLVYFN